MFIKERVVINPCPPCPKPLPIPPGEIGSTAVEDKNDVNYYGDDLAFCYKFDSVNNQAIISLKFILEHWPNSHNGYALRIKAKDINNQVVSIDSIIDTTLSGNSILAVARLGGWYEVIQQDPVDLEYKGNIEVHISNPLALPNSGHLRIEFELGYYPNSQQTTYSSYLTESVMKGHPCQKEGVRNILRKGWASQSTLIEKSKITPNPVSDYLEVIFEEDIDINESVQVKVIDMKGNLIISPIHTTELRPNNNSIILKGLESLNSGVYTLLLESNGIVQTKKFIKL